MVKMLLQKLKKGLIKILYIPLHHKILLKINDYNVPTCIWVEILFLGHVGL
jgi:hypothetical protein